MAIWECESSINNIRHIIGANDTEHLTNNTLHLRDDIKDLCIMDLDVTSIDVQFPKNITRLSISTCRNLTHIPNFPPNLERLHISYLPNLAIIPQIPKSVTYLCICNTNVSRLQPIEHLKLTECYLHSNNLKLIPTLPKTIKHFNCFHNPLVTLPILPVPVEKMKSVEFYRDGDPISFDENEQLTAECIALVTNILNNQLLVN